MSNDACSTAAAPTFATASGPLIQKLDPVHSTLGSTLVALVPIVLLLVLLAVLRMSAWAGRSGRAGLARGPARRTGVIAGVGGPDLAGAGGGGLAGFGRWDSGNGR